MRTCVILIFALFSLGSLLVRTNVPVAPGKITAPKRPIPAPFFGLHIHYLDSGTPWPAIPFGTWRLWDTHVTWPYLEPVKGQWNFKLLDRYVEEARRNGAEILLPLGLCPRWASSRPDEFSPYAPGWAAPPKDINDWRVYVRTVARRYQGRVYKYEIWNEPNLKDFFSGSTKDMLQLSAEAYAILKAVDQRNLVVSSAATEPGGIRWLRDFIGNGGGNYADVIGFHFYVPRMGPPEAMLPLIREVRGIMEANGAGGKPLWNTETGWFIQSAQKPVHMSHGVVLPQDKAAAYLARALTLAWASGVQRFYWYAWDNSRMGLVEPDRTTLKPPAQAYREIENWLLGAVMKSCASDEVGTWTCELSRGNTYRAWIVWNPQATRNFTPPASWEAMRVHELSGAVRELSTSKHIEISAAPVLFDNESP